MKKSEMLGKIWTLLYQQTDLEESFLEELSVMVLDTVEKEGMEPPTRIRYPTDNDWNEKFDNVPFESNSWEKE